MKSESTMWGGGRGRGRRGRESPLTRGEERREEERHSGMQKRHKVGRDLDKGGGGGG